MTFIEEMQRRLAQAPPLLPPLSKLGGGLASSYSSPNLSRAFAAAAGPSAENGAGEGNGNGNGGMSRVESQDLFDASDTPFELRVLEVALDVVRSSTDSSSARRSRMS